MTNMWAAAPPLNMTFTWRLLKDRSKWMRPESESKVPLTSSRIRLWERSSQFRADKFSNDLWSRISNEFDLRFNLLSDGKSLKAPPSILDRALKERSRVLRGLRAWVPPREDAAKLPANLLFDKSREFREPKSNKLVPFRDIWKSTKAKQLKICYNNWKTFSGVLNCLANSKFLK